MPMTRLAPERVSSDAKRRRALDLGPLERAQTDRTEAPDGHDIAVIDAGVDDTVIGCRQHVREEEHVLVAELLGDRQGVDVAVWHPHVLSSQLAQHNMG